MKHVFEDATRRRSCRRRSPNRKDKMGFPVPLHEWMARAGAGLRHATSSRARRRCGAAVRRQPSACSPSSDREPRSAARSGACCRLELWQQRVPRPRATEFKRLLTQRKDCEDSMKVLITGGAGFVGSHLADRLLAARRRGPRHRQLRDRPARQPAPRATACTIVEETIADRPLVDGAFERFAPDRVVHAAASYKDPDDWGEDVRTNVARHGQRRRARRRPPASTGSSTSRPRSATAPARSSSRSRSTIRSGPTAQLRDLQDRRRAVHRAGRARLRLVPPGQRLRAAQH